MVLFIQHYKLHFIIILFIKPINLFEFVMIKDKCCREINDSLQKTFAKSVLNKFASNLGIDINNGEGGQAWAKDT